MFPPHLYSAAFLDKGRSNTRQHLQNNIREWRLHKIYAFMTYTQ
jgi:hypothetical protein